MSTSLGQGFKSKLASEARSNPFVTSSSPFESDSLRDMPVLYHRRENCRGSYVSTASSRTSSTSDHLSLSLGVGVGNEYLGASVTGHYDKNVIEDRALSKSSRRSSFSAGALEFLRPPPLSMEARFLLDTPDAGLVAFKERYGDFYVSALTVGADAAIMMTQASNARATSEQIKIEGEVHFLCWSDTETIMESHVADAVRDAQFGITAFDTLHDSFVSVQLDNGDGLSFQDARRLSKDYLDRVDDLAARTEEALLRWPQLHMMRTKKLFWTDVESLAQSNLISRIILSPFETHREIRPYLL
ncbi:Hypothetical protein D9617_14g077690 [Elsinoe fawcettii]|nr:Hypothetical protein D9617_14g077690 [Elsinoe fawcettii]